MAKIELGRYSDLLRRSLGMKGQEMVASELSPELSPVWVLEDAAIEWLFLKQVRACSAAASTTSIAAQFGRYALVNPAASRMVATVSMIRMTANAGVGVELRLIDAELANFATIGQAGPRDTRWEFGAGQTVSPIIFSSENNVATIAGGFLVHTQITIANQNFALLPEKVVLAPGATLFWGISSANITTRSSVHWTERALPELEG